MGLAPKTLLLNQRSKCFIRNPKKQEILCDRKLKPRDLGDDVEYDEQV